MDVGVKHLLLLLDREGEGQTTRWLFAFDSTPTFYKGELKNLVPGSEVFLSRLGRFRGLRARLRALAACLHGFSLRLVV